jgi:hypothetical protein
MRRNGLLVIVAVCSSLAPATVSSGEAPKKASYAIDYQIWEGDPLGSREEHTLSVVAYPRQVALEKEETSFHSGGSTKFKAEDVETGITIKITPEKGENGTIRLKAFLQTTEVTSQTKDGLVTHTNQARYIRTIKSGERVRLRAGKSNLGEVWVELTVTEIAAEK